MGQVEMYSPIHDGIDKSVRSVQYSEAPPPSSLVGFVHCFWELKTITDLPEDFHYHALPDACVNILFNQIETDIAGVTALRTKAEVLNLGTSFHYVGIQFYPGVWRGKTEEIVDRYVGTPYLGSLPLIQVSERIKDMDRAVTFYESVLGQKLEKIIDLRLGRLLQSKRCTTANESIRLRQSSGQIVMITIIILEYNG